MVWTYLMVSLVVRIHPSPRLLLRIATCSKQCSYKGPGKPLCEQRDREGKLGGESPRVLGLVNPRGLSSIGRAPPCRRGRCGFESCSPTGGSPHSFREESPRDVLLTGASV